MSTGNSSSKNKNISIDVNVRVSSDSGSVPSNIMNEVRQSLEDIVRVELRNELGFAVNE